ncbi:MAG: hypothetical protein ABFD98_00915 [Syntrophobacteraceae bacterium]|nr:hypothetical protein [Desulfobacteraceae bacterium]
MKRNKCTYSKSGYKVDRPLDPPRKIQGTPGIKVNDRVSTPHGFGTVVEISGDRFLVALDGQIGRVWERLSSLKSVS